MTDVWPFRTKAVANGALAWYVDNPVSARVAKFHYGVEVSIPFDPSHPDMVCRLPFRNNQGELRVENAWHPIVAKVSDLDPSSFHYVSYISVSE
jgi:glutamate mutase epsilon subunit